MFKINTQYFQNISLNRCSRINITYFPWILVDFNHLFKNDTFIPKNIHGIHWRVENSMVFPWFFHGFFFHNSRVTREVGRSLETPRFLAEGPSLERGLMAWERLRKAGTLRWGYHHRVPWNIYIYIYMDGIWYGMCIYCIHICTHTHTYMYI